MTEQSRSEDPSVQDPTRQDQTPPDQTQQDLGGPGAALGSGVENALTGEQPREDDEGKASTSLRTPRPAEPLELAGAGDGNRTRVISLED